MIHGRSYEQSMSTRAMVWHDLGDEKGSVGSALRCPVRDVLLGLAVGADCDEIFAARYGAEIGSSHG